MTIGRLTIAPSRLAACTTATALAVMLSACGQDNRYVAPPPPKVTVAVPVQQTVTRYLEATGNTAAVNTTNLVARVQGFLQEINYKDGDLVKQGTTLFVIEPEPYKLKLEQAQAAEAGAQAALKQAEADYERQAELASRQVASKAALDNATANRDSAVARLKQAQVDTQAGRDQSRLHAGQSAVRRHRHRAPGLARRIGRRQRSDPARHHRRRPIRSTSTSTSTSRMSCTSARRSGGSASPGRS